MRVPITAEVPVFDVKYKSRMRFRDVANCKKIKRHGVKIKRPSHKL